jgi:HEPN superfamily RiboL-PSP-like protein
MADLVLDDFKSDLNRLKKLLSFMEMVRSFTAINVPDIAGDDFTERSKGLHASSKDCHGDFLILSGAMVLYLGGRFEFFVRERFEEACDDIAGKCVRFLNLPKPMQDNLIKLTAEVMLSPRKYGHGEKGVESFVKNLAANMSADNGLADINRKCLSITTDNMRPDVVRDLFKRIGLDDIWKSVGEQAAVKAHFALAQSEAASAKTREYLNEVMDIRNAIAHPSANVQWPDISKVSNIIEFFEVIAPVLCDVISVHESVQTDHKAAATAEAQRASVEQAATQPPASQPVADNVTQQPGATGQNA